jgi:hypothetical protein
LLLRELLDGARDAVARIVDDDIEAAEAVVGLPDSRERGLVVGDVKLDGQDGIAVFGGVVFQRGGVARRSGNPVARRECGLGKRTAKAARRACDEPIAI